MPHCVSRTPRLAVALFAAAALSIVVAVPALGSAAAPRPNLILIVADDLSARTLGCMGDPVVQTPHIDRLAANGVLFRNAFVTTSICWMSRASIFTGQWYSRHGIKRSNVALSPEQWANSYPALLRRAGYRTGFIGKFGVGSTNDLAVKAKTFDFWRGLPGQAGLFFDDNDPKHRHKTARFGDEAIEFIAGCTREQPFCLSLSFNAPHARDGQPREYPPDGRDAELYDDVTMPVSPLANDVAFRKLPLFVQTSEGRKRWQRRFSTPEQAQSILRDYYRLVTGIDREVGRIVAALEHAKLAEKTVIIFTSDNGYALGDRGLADKWFMYEEDIRVPLIVFDPRLSGGRRGRKVAAMALNVDLAPTLLDLAGLAPRASMQGRSLVPLLQYEQPPADWRTDFFYEHHFFGAVSIPAVEGVRSQRWAYMRWTDAQPVVEELYDLAADPLETKNLASDPAVREQLDLLRARWAVLKEQAR